MKTYLTNAIRRTATPAARRQRGLTAIELIIGLAVMALVIAGVAATARTMFRDQKINSEVTRLQLMQQKLRAFYSTSANTLGVDADQVVTIGAVAPDAISGAAGAWTITSKFGGAVTLGATTANPASPNDAITISYANVPPVECINFIKAAGQSFDAVGTGGAETAATENVKAFGVNLPIENATVVDECDADQNTIQFTMLRQ